MIKKRIKKVTYQVWEECECGGRLESHKKLWEGWSGTIIKGVTLCQECGRTDNPFTGDSPRIIEEYEEIDE